jgi:hypothetical protein
VVVAAVVDLAAVVVVVSLVVVATVAVTVAGDVVSRPTKRLSGEMVEKWML